MENKQLFAKVAVSILIGLNVGAYYVFWPHQDGGAKQAPKKPDEDRGQTKLLPSKAEPTKVEPVLPNPLELPPIASVPLNIPNPTKAELSHDEAVNKLLDHIKRDKDDRNDSSPAIPMFPEDVLKPAVDKNVGVTSPLTPKVPLPPIRWIVVPAASSRTLIVANVKLDNPAIKFALSCGSLTNASQDGDVEAKGTVRLEGLDVIVNCDRLTFAHAPSRIVFDGQVVVTPVNPNTGQHPMRTDRIVWEFAPTSPKATLLPPPLGPPK